MECFELLCLRERVSGMLGDREAQRNDLALLSGVGRQIRP